MKKIFYLFLMLSVMVFSYENYVIVKKENAKIYSENSEKSEVITSFKGGKQLFLADYDETFAKILYKSKDGLDYVGYIKRKDIYIRELDKNKALSKIIELNDFVNNKLKENRQLIVTESYGYDQDLKGAKNKPDTDGERAANAQIFYKEPSEKSKWIYVADRSLLAIEGYENNFLKVSIPNKNGFYYIKKNKVKYTINTGINNIVEKVVVVDRMNQNTQLYDYVGGEFLLTEAFQSTTGYNDNINSYRTPKGFYLVSNVKPFMTYYDEINKNGKIKKTGKAVYAVRFSGGYYLHGIPVKDEAEGNERINMKKRVEGKLGTHPSSHGCVRNSDDNAKFIYDWVNSVELKTQYYIPQTPVVVVVTD